MKTFSVLLVASLLFACAAEPAPQTARRRAAPTDERARPEQPARPMAEPATKSPPPVRRTGGKVDCQRMCNKTFILCVGEVLVASGKMSEDKIRLIRRAGAWSKVQQAGYRACMKDCKKKKGFGSDAAGINQCLSHTHCAQYASCINKHIK